MKEKTAKDLVTLHNRLARLHNLFCKIDTSEFDEKEKEKFKNLEDQAFKLMLDYYSFKTKVFNERDIPIPDVY